MRVKFLVEVLGCLLLVLSVNAQVACRSSGKGSLEYILSHDFSEITQDGNSDLVLKFMDWPIRERTQNVRTGEYIKASDTELFFRIKQGDSFRFFRQGTGRSLTLSVTNGIRPKVAGTLIHSSDKKGLQLLVSERIGNGDGFRPEIRVGESNCVDVVVRDFLVDVGLQRCYDLTAGTESRFAWPFHAFWRDWDDYQERFLGRPKRDVPRELLARGACWLRQVRQHWELMNQGEMLSAEARRVVKFKLDGASPYDTGLVELRKKGSQIIVVAILAVSMERQSGTAWAGFAYDELGGVVWHEQVSSQGLRGAFEFDGKGCLLRFAEVDKEGHGLSRWSRSIRERPMLAKGERAAFLKKAESFFAVLVKSWEDKSYRRLPLEEKADADTAERRTAKEKKLAEVRVQTGRAIEQVEREREAKWHRLNKERRDRGQDELTATEKRIILRDERIDRARREIEHCRHKIERVQTTTEADRLNDLERARLWEMFNTAEWRYRMALRRFSDRDLRPASLRDLLTVKTSDGVALLPGGEKDLKDSWGHDYRYCVGKGLNTRLTRERAIITSAGPDGIFGTSDDLSSNDWFDFHGRAGVVLGSVRAD